MLTRIEIDGFKSFREFVLDVPPFLVIIGRNAAGKSNLFDAIQFLGRLAGDPVLEAAQHMRGDITDLFHRHTDETSVEVMSFAVEVLLGRRTSIDLLLGYAAQLVWITIAVLTLRLLWSRATRRYTAVGT